MFWPILRYRTSKIALPPCYKYLAPPFRQFSQSSSRPFLRSSRWVRQEATKATRETIDVGPSFYEKIGKPRISKQIINVTAASMGVLSLAAIFTNIETEYWTERMTAASAVWSLKAITNTDLKRAQNAELIQTLRIQLTSLHETVQHLPALIRPWISVAYVSVMQPYADASEGKRLCWKICLLNTAVWAAWQVKGWQGFMSKRFMHHPLSGLSYTLLTSVFSHRSIIHLLFNCLALESFGSAAYYYLLREQNKAEPDMLESTTAYHFLAFFVSAGLFSGLVSHVVNAKFRYPHLVAQLASPTNAARKTETWAGAVASSTATAARVKAKSKVLDILPSLGASGAVYAAVAMTALAFPESQVALFIPPSYPISIQYGVGGILALDMIGVLRGWRMFDHWAHLGGAAFGVLYYAYGPTYWRHLREMVQVKEDES